jgi:dihydrofolate reductase
MIISAIVAVAKNNVIGLDNQIPWYLPADLAYFKRMTLDHHIIMGRNSFQSIGRLLPKRTNVVISRDPFFIATGCVRAFSIEEALAIAEENGETEAFIIGGGEIYRQSEPFWDRLYLTEVDLTTEGDVFFPQIDPEEWRLVSEEFRPKDEKNEFDCTFKVFERIGIQNEDLS